MTAHQRRIRDEMALADPRAITRTLHGYSVEPITRADATPIIIRYEWLGTLRRTTSIFVGLFSPIREIEGVACFGRGPSYGPSDIRQVIGSPALCLERGACVHYAPRNAASYLINAACKLVYRNTGTSLFFAYADPMAGEYGGVYQAAGWLYIGQGLAGAKGHRTHRWFVLPPGADPSVPWNWKTTRVLRPHDGPSLSWAEARSQGWRIEEREAKHVYAIDVGSTRRNWRRETMARVLCNAGLSDTDKEQFKKQGLPYPAPHPELKRKRIPPSESAKENLSAPTISERLLMPPSHARKPEPDQKPGQ